MQMFNKEGGRLQELQKLFDGFHSCLVQRVHANYTSYQDGGVPTTSSRPIANDFFRVKTLGPIAQLSIDSTICRQDP